MPHNTIATLLQTDAPLANVCVNGWVRTRRDAKDFSFIEINDGSCLANLQVIAGEEIPDYAVVGSLTTGAAVQVMGDLVLSEGKGQKWELKAKALTLLGAAPETYPLQKKRHSDEFLRTIAHLRPRTNKYGAVFRIRSELSFAVHQFFRERGFKYIQTPILTASDCEGAGELFRVTTLDSGRPGAQPDDAAADFFGTEVYLTVSGQLAVEMFALALGRVYTFGPTFRAENSNTRRHVAEFWMIEPEMAFYDLNDTMTLGETLIQSLVAHTLTECREDLELFARFVDKTLYDRLASITARPFARITHAEAVALLRQSGVTFDNPVGPETDLQTEHERFLTETYFKQPVIVYNYPKSIKPFYMRVNDDQQTVAAMDVLMPQIGEVIGGSQREERLEILEQRMRALGLPLDKYWWYLDSRRYGSVPHSGFGLGFERFLMLLTGVSNIRDVIAFPRTPGKIDF